MLIALKLLHEFLCSYNPIFRIYLGIQPEIPTRYFRKEKTISNKPDLFYLYSLSFSSSLLAYEDVHIIERLFSSSLIAIVSSQAPRKLKVCHFKKGSEICSYSFANNILAVKLNRTVSDHHPRLLINRKFFFVETCCLFGRKYLDS